MSALTIGLTGGIASGKSRVADEFRKLGVPVLDADEVSRQAVEPPSAVLDEIARVFGPGILQADGRLDRRRLREQVFENAAARRQLEAITHPGIRQRMMEWKNQQTAPYCILSVAILFEAGFDSMVDRTLVVDCSEEDQRRRLVARDGVDDTLASRMLQAQMPRESRVRRAHDLLNNDGTLAELEAGVLSLHRTYLTLASAKPSVRDS